MGVIRKIALRNMKRRKTRYILTTLSLIIGVALFGGIMIASDTFYDMMLTSIDEQSGTADVLIRKDTSGNGWFLPNDIKKDIKDTSHVEAVSFRISGFSVFVSGVLAGGTKDTDSTYSALYGIDINSENEKVLGGTPYLLDAIKQVDGETTIEGLLDYEDDVTGDRVIVITESMKIKLGKDVEAGSVVKILPTNYTGLGGYNEYQTSTWLSYTVTAVIRDSGEAVDFDPKNPTESESISQSGALFFIDLEITHELVDGTEDHTNEVNLAVVGVDDMHNADAVTEDLDDELKNGYVASDLKSSSVESVDNTMTIIRAMFMMFGLIALILSIVLIMNIFNIIREEQEYETGMFQAIGASKGETFKLFLTQGVLMGVIGALIGTILSYFISYWIFQSVVNTMQSINENENAGFGSTINEFSIVLLPTTLIATFLVGFGSCLIASIYPSYKASKKPLIECLNPIEEKSEREKKKIVKPMLYAALGTFLVVYSGYMIMTMSGFSQGPAAGDSSVTQSIVSTTAPTYMLLGIIILCALMVRPLSKGLIHLFKPYLKQTTRLTEKNILRHRKRTVLTFTMIALTVSYLVGMSVQMDSMRAGIDTTVDDFMGADARVWAYGTPRSLEEDLMKIDGVKDIMGIRYQSAMVRANGEWVGHLQLDTDYDSSITINILDTDKVNAHMTNTEIVSPTDMTLKKMLKEIKDGKKIIITEDFADEYDVKVGDSIPVKFSLGVEYSSLSAMQTGKTTDAQEATITVKMEVVAIVKKIQGFFSIASFGYGDSDVSNYMMFVSWETYEKEVAPYKLPGGGTDLAYRSFTQTGNLTLDAALGNWFNFSNVETYVMNSIANIDYYSTRMDSLSLTLDQDTTTSFTANVVGIHTNSSGKLVSDSYFGNSTLLAKDNAYTGSIMEELLNTEDNVTVVDQTYVNSQTDGFGIGSNISIFPQERDPIPIILSAGAGLGPYYPNTTVSLINGAYLSGSLENLTLSDDQNLTYVSVNNNLTLNINYFVGNYLAKDPKPIYITLESTLNATVDNLVLQALNLYNTTKYDTLGSINSNENHTLPFNLNHMYINSTGFIQLRITGRNSTAETNFSLAMDSLRLTISLSKYNLTDPSNWPTFKVIGIIDSPKLYDTECYNWYATSNPIADAKGNSIYLNYNKTRDLVFPDFKGSNSSNDYVTSVLVHCNNVANIESVQTSLAGALFSLGQGYWTVVDLKTRTLDNRKSAIDWYIWIDTDADEEEVLSDIQQYIQDHGYIVIFGFTRTFMISTFNSMIDLITFITYGMLILAIIISLIGLALHALLTTMSRRREIGMLRSIGLSKKGIVRTISGETLIVSLLGVLIGIFAGLIQGTISVLSQPAGGFLSTTLVIPWLTIGILIFITVVAAILSSRFPARWAANLNIIDAVRTR